MQWIVQIAASIILGVIIAIGASLFSSSQVAVAPVENISVHIQSVATSTIATTTQPTIVQKLPTPTKQTPQPAETPKPVPVTNSQNTVTSAPQSLPAAATAPSNSVTDTVRAAIVNIICTTQTSGPFSSISGSGVFIDSRGVILTNAHIAQYFLLKDYPTPGFVNCVIRTGSPASPRYTADLLFMPPSWMAANAYKINQNDPTGNGEHDYSLLLVTGAVSSSVQMPSSFPALPISVTPPSEAEKVLLAAYPAQFLGGITVAENLYESSAQAVVGDLYTFVANTLDLFSVGGTVVAQKGSSGGAVADANGSLLGLIVTASEGATTGASDLRALSTSYIINDFAKESGTSLQSFLLGNVASEMQQFSANTAPTLRGQLENAIEHK